MSKENAEATIEKTDEATAAAEETTTQAAQPDPEIEKLRKENEDLRRQQFVRRPDAPAKVTSEALRGLNEAQWKEIEDNPQMTGQTRHQIILAVENQELKSSHAETQAKLNVRDALDTAVEKDPQVSKLKVGMREYLDDVPLEDKADADKLARHIERAKVFARGRLAEKGIRTLPNPGKPVMRTPEPEGNDDSSEGEGSDDRKVKSNQTVMLGGLKLKIGDFSDGLKKRLGEFKHPNDPNGVMLKGLDKKPTFRRSE